MGVWAHDEAAKRAKQVSLHLLPCLHPKLPLVAKKINIDIKGHGRQR